jgi:hypothetical protein
VAMAVFGLRSVQSTRTSTRDAHALGCDSGVQISLQCRGATATTQAGPSSVRAVLAEFSS